MNKNMKMHTQLTIGFTIIGILLVISLYTGYTSAAQILNAEDPEQYLSSYATFTAVEFFAMFILTAGIAVSLTRIIRVNMKKMTDAAKEMAAGNVNIDLGKQGNNEFGMVLTEIQKVVDNNRYMAELLQQIASGDMTVSVQPRSEGDVMGVELKKLVEQNHHSISNIKEAAFQVSTSSSQVASASEALAQGSTEQASAIEQITASIADVAEKTKQNASEANAAAELMVKAIVDVKKGNEEMQEMVVAMQDINKSSESISKIIKVIDDIAFQTNILALNAAVEAARAGEAGKGFAVVAEEVRNLAAKSASAAAETAEMIEDSIHKVEAGSKIADSTAQALEDITEAVQKSEIIITEIAESSNYQATAIAQIDQAIEQVSQVVQNNSATSEECAAASVELSEQAARVRELLAVYKLEAGVAGTENSKHRTGGNADKKETVTSLKEGFGKY